MTWHIEHARACTALRSTQVAIAQLQVVRMLDEALLSAHRAQSDIETTIRALGRAAQGA